MRKGKAGYVSNEDSRGGDGSGAVRTRLCRDAHRHQVSFAYLPGACCVFQREEEKGKGGTAQHPHRRSDDSIGQRTAIASPKETRVASANFSSTAQPGMAASTVIVADRR